MSKRRNTVHRLAPRETVIDRKVGGPVTSPLRAVVPGPYSLVSNGGEVEASGSLFEMFEIAAEELKRGARVEIRRTSRARARSVLVSDGADKKQPL